MATMPCPGDDEQTRQASKRAEDISRQVLEDVAFMAEIMEGYEQSLRGDMVSWEQVKRERAIRRAAQRDGS